jgi:uncharacterized protein YutE (UPF0331/DUF86 family)
MTPLPERLAELRKHLAHLRELEPGVPDARVLEDDLSLHNDVLFSLLTVAQLVIDVAGELASRGGFPFSDYTEAVRNLRHLGDPSLPPEMVERLARLPGFRNILIHEYVGLDYDLVIRALRDLEPVEDFARAVARRLDG